MEREFLIIKLKVNYVKLCTIVEVTSAVVQQHGLVGGGGAVLHLAVPPIPVLAVGQLYADLLSPGREYAPANEKTVSRVV